MKHINRTGRSAANLVEQMETRRMLSAAVSHHTLVIDGTARADTIVLTMASPRTLTVRVGDVETNVPRKSFGKIRITAGRGDDLVTVGSDANPINAPVSVSGGDGSDTIVGGAGNDSLSGGAGADLIAGGAGNDKIGGDNGNDDLHGGDGRDSINGGRGDDQLHDDAGRDALYGNAGSDVCYYHDDVKQFRDAGKHEQTYNEPVFQILPGVTSDLVLNTCPLYAPDGTPITGGLVQAGGSVLVVAGSVLGQWAGEGLEVSNAFVPHFDIPGAGIIATGSGTLGVSSGVIISSGSTLEVSGVSSLFGTNTNTFTGSTLINGGTLTFTGGANSSLNGITINASNDNPILLDAGSIIAAPDGSTQTLAAGESLTVTGPSKVTTPTGTTITVNDNVTIHLAGKPGDTATTGDTSTPPADPDPTPTPPADPDPTSTPPTDPA